MAKKLSKEDVVKLADLARLNLTEEEIEDYRLKLVSIVDYVATLHKVNTNQVSEMAHAAGLVNVFREDEVTGSSQEQKERLINNFPRREGDLLEVPGVFEDK